MSGTFADLQQQLRDRPDHDAFDVLVRHRHLLLSNDPTGFAKSARGPLAEISDACCYTADVAMYARRRHAWHIAGCPKHDMQRSVPMAVSELLSKVARRPTRCGCLRGDQLDHHLSDWVRRDWRPVVQAVDVVRTIRSYDTGTPPHDGDDTRQLLQAAHTALDATLDLSVRRKMQRVPSLTDAVQLAADATSRLPAHFAPHRRELTADKLGVPADEVNQLPMAVMVAFRFDPSPAALAWDGAALNDRIDVRVCPETLAFKHGYNAVTLPPGPVPDGLAHVLARLLQAHSPNDWADLRNDIRQLLPAAYATLT